MCRKEFTPIGALSLLIALITPDKDLKYNLNSSNNNYN